MPNARRAWTFRAVLALLALATFGSAGMTSYTLKWGDTLSRVASKFGVPVAAITSTNGIADANRVREGQKLQIPDRASAQVAAAVPAAAVTPAAHTVKAGETLSEIAKAYGVTARALADPNGLKDLNFVREGRVLTLPPGATPVATSIPTPLCPVKGAGKWDFADSFGAPRHGGRSHAGNDIFAKRGTAVVASMSGTLARVTGSLTGIGYELAGEDGVTYYGAHLDALSAAAGRVTRGDVLGVVGNTGNAHGTPPHLHFEVKPGGGASINPYALLRGWCN